ncbi:hypothetical protein ABL78_4738 [Leptomonas seymouri]|uniref:Transmembrane protein n=1 Tax=Leptomonas seymouri TaxID=5684 RepID=A0A0N1I5Y1_LEPSE|nr:hypothetical protein ABL78_4738 [Leptomonas seymouri]|eukprot:KPI86185.1 hypothetical protein ABL78_4738 [Leptomonas seymouri]
MSSCAHRRLQRCLSFILLATLLHICTGHCFVSSQQQQHGSTSDAQPFCKVEFASSYFASIATTMPIADHPPLAQTGHLYVDRAAGLVRIDQFFRNQRATFLLDNRRLRGFLFFGERDFQRKTAATEAPEGDEDKGDGERRSCHVFYLSRKVAPFCVPQSYTVESLPSMVRGVATTRFTGMEGYPDMPLVEQYLYVVNSSASVNADVNASAAPPSLSFAPWRLEYRARPDLEPQKIAGAPYTVPNWRFFGHPMFDELVLSSAQETPLQLWQPTVDLLTIDFYDYYPLEHQEDTFAVPPECTAIFKGTASSGNETQRRGHDAHTQNQASPQLQLATIQRFLLQWHLLQDVSAASAEGEESVSSTLKH